MKQSTSSFSSHIRAFTIVEILATVGIIALLLGGTLVAVSAARKNSQRTRVKSDLSIIGLALEAYHHDFGDYPRFADPAVDQAANNAGTDDGWLDYTSDRGARLLCRALIAPGPEAGSGGTSDGQDGCNGPGFRIRRTAASNGQLTGKVYGPYLAADKFKLEFNPSQPNMQDAKMLDIFGNPILYYPALPGKPNILEATHGIFVWKVDPSDPTPKLPDSTTNARAPFYNPYDNTADLTTGKPLLSEHDMAYLLGDTTFDGGLNPASEEAVTLQPYLLWTAGFDGIFGRDAKGKTDDITNFDFEPGTKK